MRLAALTLIVAACGRVGFDAKTGDGGTDDAIRGDGEVPATCIATLVANFTAPAPVSNILAEKTPAGYAIGFISGTGSVLQGVAVDTSFVANTDLPFRTSPAQGLDINYSSASLYWTGTVLAGSTSVIEDDSCYLKVYSQDMAEFLAADQRQNCDTSEPSIARAGSSLLFTWHGATEHYYTALSDEGDAIGGDVALGSSAATIGESSVASGQVAIKASALGNNSCELRQLPSDDVQTLAGCSAPHIVGMTDTKWLLAYEAATVVHTRLVTRTAQLMLTLDAVIDLGTGSDPRLFQSNGTWLAAIKSGPGLLLRSVDPVQTVPISGLPASIDAFEVAGPSIFAVSGGDLYAITCP